MELFCRQYQVAEWPLVSTVDHGDPFNELDVDIVVAGPGGLRMRVPAYWAGGAEWRVRFSAPLPGEYTFCSECTDEGDGGLHGREGRITAAPAAGSNPLYAHGAVRVSGDRRGFEHADGTPFFWLGDTWWMCLSERLSWPEDFQRLAADRCGKGFSVIQLVAGFYPDMDLFDERNMNGAGFPWERDLVAVNPRYFDLADLRIQWLVRSGLVPCIVGGWGYYVLKIGPERMGKHWRYLIARYGAYPVVWCLAGEARMPWYLSESREEDSERQVSAWTEVGRTVRSTDPYHRLITIHPDVTGRDQVKDDGVLDFDMLQTGHHGREVVPNTIRILKAELKRRPVMPVMIGEVLYEGIMHESSDEMQRCVFWASMLSGSAGYTYGANGIWQFNRPGAPYGASPPGHNWGNTAWQDAVGLPGSRQLGIAKSLLERCEWRRFEPHQDWVSPAAGDKDFFACYAAGIAGEVRIIYVWRGGCSWDRITVLELERSVKYRAYFFDPRNGEEHGIGEVVPDGSGSWVAPVAPTIDDWVIVLQKA
ncbi:MAG: DUF4038 domain-containing protein [Planctomycetes bacterium]|nr:DUF4038 domain-containing protein [Planctomycetota bacterium]